MSQIHLLSEEVINKIAAGEVVERPASVVKELIENSLDAQATKIIIEIKEAGKELIKITDNGSGMDQADAHHCLLRHATSKIESADDLFNINTLGFRGEALASIAAVSKLSLTTKQKDKLEGIKIEVEGGQVIDQTITAAETGTTIEVKELFFNTPARKKFLKSDSVELRHLLDVVTKYALINKKIAFKLLHNNNELLNSPSAEDLRSNILSIYGLSLAKDLLEVNYADEKEGLKIFGYIAKPHQARNDKNQQALFVNGRWIKNEDITKAVYDAYHSLLFVNKHPILVLNLEINPQKIDVNVHPNKLEIKFEQKEIIYKNVYRAIKDTLEKNNLIPASEFAYELQLSFGRGVKKEETKKNNLENSETSKYAFEPSEQTILQVKEAEAVLAGGNDFSENNFTENFALPQTEENSEITENIKFPSLKILGQIHKTFFVAETNGGLMLIDQHVVQERVLYEKFMSELMTKKVSQQILLQKEVLEFSPAEKMALLENKAVLEEWGFQLEQFGQNSFLLKTVPLVFGRLQPKEMLSELLNSLLEEKNRLAEVKEDIITRMACRASIKAGDSVTIPEIKRLLFELSLAKFPYTCPHGRAIMIKIPVDELEKKFRRKG